METQTDTPKARTQMQLERQAWLDLWSAVEAYATTHNFATRTAVSDALERHEDIMQAIALKDAACDMEEQGYLGRPEQYLHTVGDEIMRRCQNRDEVPS